MQDQGRSYEETVVLRNWNACGKAGDVDYETVVAPPGARYES